MKVWVLLSRSYRDTEVLGVFTTAEKAMAAWKPQARWTQPFVPEWVTPGESEHSDSWYLKNAPEDDWALVEPYELDGLADVGGFLVSL